MLPKLVHYCTVTPYVEHLLPLFSLQLLVGAYECTPEISRDFVITWGAVLLGFTGRLDDLLIRGQPIEV